MAGFKAHKPDGTKGTATLEVTYKEGKKEITKSSHGCIVENDSNLKNIIQNNHKPGADLRKFDKSKYYFYTCDGDFAEIYSIIEIIISCHRFSKPNEEKKGKLEYSPLHVIKVQQHIFLLCDCGNFNKSRFLEKHSKRLQVPESLDAVIKNESLHGLAVIEDKPIFIPLKLNCPQQSSNGFDVDPECYKQLKDAGPILLQDEKKVVGSYMKLTDENRIAISVFGHVQEEVCVKIKSEKPEGCKNERKQPQAQSSVQEPIPGPSGMEAENLTVRSDESEHERSEEGIIDEQIKKELEDESKVEMVKTTEEDGRRKRSEKTEGCKQEQQDPEAQSSLQDRISGLSEIGKDLARVRSDENEPGRAQEGIADLGTNKEDETVKATGPAGESHGKDQFNETDSTRKEFSSLTDTCTTRACDTGHYSSFQSVVSSDEKYSQAKSFSTLSVNSTKMKAEKHSTQSSAQGYECMRDECNYDQSEPSSIASGHSTQEKAEEHSLSMQSHNQGHQRDYSYTRINLRNESEFKKYRGLLIHIAINLGKDWETVGYRLSLLWNDLHLVKENNKKDIREQAYQMLLTWIKKPDTNPTLSDLRRALEESGRKDLSEQEHLSVEVLSRDVVNDAHETRIMVKDDLLNQVAQHLSKDWKFVGRFLDLDENVLDKQDQDNFDNVTSRAAGMLIAWKNNCKDGEATTWVLKEALRRMKREDVIQKIEGKTGSPNHLEEKDHSKVENLLPFSQEESISDSGEWGSMTGVASENDDAEKTPEKTSVKPVRELCSGCSGCVEKDRIIQERDRIIQERDRIIQERDRIIQEKDRIIQERDRIIQERDRTIQEKDRTIQILTEQQVHGRENRLKRRISGSRDRSVQRTGNGTKMPSPLTINLPDNSELTSTNPLSQVHSVPRSTSAHFPSLHNAIATSTTQSRSNATQPRLSSKDTVGTSVDCFDSTSPVESCDSGYNSRKSDLISAQSTHNTLNVTPSTFHPYPTDDGASNASVWTNSIYEPRYTSNILQPRCDCETLFKSMIEELMKRQSHFKETKTKTKSGKYTIYFECKNDQGH